MGESDADKNIPVGIGGWLVLFLFSMMVLGPLMDVLRFAEHPEEVNLLTVLTTVAVHGLGLYAGILMLQGKAKGVRWARIRLIAGACLGALGAVATIVGAYQHTTESSQVVSSLRPIAYAAFWLAYLGESKRVKNTYFRTPEPPTVANPPTQTIQPEKSVPEVPAVPSTTIPSTPRPRRLNGWQLLRRIAREATIFTLLGPIATTIIYLSVQAYNAPRSVPHTPTKMCSNYLKTSSDPLTALGIPAEPAPAKSTQDPFESAGTPAEPEPWWIREKTLPCLVGAKRNDIVTPTKFNGLPTIELNDDLYVKGYDGAWIYFPGGRECPVPRLERVVNHIPLSAYVHSDDALLFSLVFGWPFGFAAWMFYRIVRFAITG